MKTNSASEFLTVLDAGTLQPNGDIIIAVSTNGDDETPQAAVERCFGGDVAKFFAAGWTADWTGNGDTWGDGEDTWDVRLTPPAIGARIREAVAALRANSQDPEDLVREWKSCREAEIDAAGDIWVADPQEGHWLSDDELAAFLAWLERRR